MNLRMYLEFDNIILTVLFLCGMNFQAKFFYFAFGLFILQCLAKRLLHYDRMLIVYSIFSIIYAMYGLSAGIMEIVRRLVFPCIYIAGYNLTLSHTTLITANGESTTESWLRKCIVVFSAGAFLHYFINMITNLGSTIGRNTLDVWSGEILSATGQAVLVCPMVGVAVACIVVPHNKKMRIFSVFTIIIILVYNMMLAGRTLIIMMLLDALFCIFIYSIYEKNRNYKLRTWGTLIAITLTAYILYNSNAFGIKTMFEQSNLYARFYGVTTTSNLTEDSRMYKKGYYLSHMWNYLFGGQHMNSQVGFAHDLLLDCFDEAGILAAIPLLIIIASSIKNLICVVRSNYMSKSSRILITSFYFCLYIQFFMEPILASDRWLFAGFCIINGCINAVRKEIQINP